MVSTWQLKEVFKQMEPVAMALLRMKLHTPNQVALNGSRKCTPVGALSHDLRWLAINEVRVDEVEALLGITAEQGIGLSGVNGVPAHMRNLDWTRGS